MTSLLEWFAEPAHAAAAASLLAVIAILVSVVALLTNRNTHKRQLRIENRLLDIEEARERARIDQTLKAKLVANLFTEPARRGRVRTKGYFLQVKNLGDAVAYDIQVFLDGKPFAEHPVAPANSQEMDQLGPRSHFRYSLAVGYGKTPPFELNITWADDSEERGFYQTTLTL